MSAKTLREALLIGVAGTVVMTAVTFVARLLHLPAADFPALIASQFGFGAIGSWLVYFAVGVGLAYAYHAYFEAKLPSHSWMRGLYFAFGLWLVTSLALMPLFGFGFFAGSLTAAFGLGFAEACFGATVGYMYEH